MDRGVLQATVHTVKKSNMTEAMEHAHMPCSSIAYTSIMGYGTHM